MTTNKSKVVIGDLTIVRLGDIFSHRETSPHIYPLVGNKTED